MKTAGAPATEVPRKPRGRPRSFDRREALGRAMEVFWRKGYEATSVQDLTEAMGINPPSLYAAFGDKEKLFLESVECYRAERGERIRRILAEEPTARGAIERAMRESVADYARRDVPPGCLLAVSANCASLSEAVRQDLARKRATMRESVRARIQRGIEEGDVPASADPLALAQFVSTVFAGMAMQARDGASRKLLTATVDNAMRAFPEVQGRVPRKASRAA